MIRSANASMAPRVSTFGELNPAAGDGFEVRPCVIGRICFRQFSRDRLAKLALKFRQFLRPALVVNPRVVRCEWFSPAALAALGCSLLILIPLIRSTS
jgi:hypothetical protein